MITNEKIISTIYLIIDSIQNPGEDEGAPADAQDVGDVLGAELVAGAVHVGESDLASILAHVDQRYHSQSETSLWR